MEHRLHGPGTVVKIVGQFRVRVQFDALGALARTVSADDLNMPEAAPQRAQAAAGEAPAAKGSAKRRRAPKPTPKAKAPPGEVSATARASIGRTISRSTAWQCLEALRLGVVPSQGAAHYTVGREKPMAVLLDLLKKGTGFHAIFGEYGEGKTHLLDALEGLARGEEFAVSRLTVDPQETAVQNPARIWAALAARLEFRGDVGLRAFLEKLSTSNDHALPDGERFDPLLSPCVFALRSGDPDCVEFALSHIMAERISLEDYRAQLRRAGWSGPSPIFLPDYRTLGGVFVRMLGTVASWTRDLGGRGLTVMLDEVERTEALSSVNYGWAVEFLQHLAAATLPETDLTFDITTLYKGGNQRHRDLAPRLESDQPLIVVTAMTPLESTMKSFQKITRVEGQTTELMPLGDGVIGDLVAGIANIYKAAYPDFDLLGSQLKSITVQVLDDREINMASFRRTVRLAVAYLDRARLVHGMPKE